MKILRRWQILGIAGLGVVLAASIGCQTNVAGMTLPSGHYLQHPPQYFAPSPAFPLQRELATQEGQGAGQAGAPGAAALPPPPVPPAPAMAPPPAQPMP